MLFVGITTITAGLLNLKNLFIPQISESATRIQGIINLSLTVLILFCVISVIADAIPRWIRAFSRSIPAPDNQIS